uniref:Protein kinase domain-containing protein n=1 Tax=Nothobranchius furzeri TaxID=105023 RepID=A0A8C6M9B7_NOTFU
QNKRWLIPAKGVEIHGNLETYRIAEVLQCGKRADIVLCHSAITNQTFVVKCKNRQFKTSFINESHILNLIQKMDSPQDIFVKTHEEFIYKNGKRLPLSAVRAIAQQMLIALDKLKDIGVTHGNIRPENVMLTNHRHQPFKIKLGGFGKADETSNLSATQMPHISGFTAPEVFLGGDVKKNTDMWSLGCMLAFLYCGKHIFPPESEYHYMKCITQVLGIYVEEDSPELRKFFKPHDLLMQNAPVIEALETPSPKCSDEYRAALRDTICPRDVTSLTGARPSP